VLDALAERDLPIENFRRSIEHDVRYANIAIIEGTTPANTASGWYRRGSPRSSLRDEQAVIPIWGATIRITE